MVDTSVRGVENGGLEIARTLLEYDTDVNFQANSQFSQRSLHVASRYLSTDLARHYSSSMMRT